MRTSLTKRAITTSGQSFLEIRGATYIELQSTVDWFWWTPADESIVRAVRALSPEVVYDSHFPLRLVNDVLVFYKGAVAGDLYVKTYLS